MSLYFPMDAPQHHVLRGVWLIPGASRSLQEVYDMEFDVGTSHKRCVGDFKSTPDLKVCMVLLTPMSLLTIAGGDDHKRGRLCCAVRQ